MVMKKIEPKTSSYKVLKCSEPKDKIHSRQQTFKSKVLKNPTPYYKEKAKNKRKPSKTNLKGPIQVWVPKSEIIFVAYMLKGKNKATTPVSGQWLLTTYNNRKSYVPNPNLEIGRKCGVWKKLASKDHWYWEN